MLSNNFRQSQLSCGTAGTFTDSGQMIEFTKLNRFNFKSYNGKMYQKQIGYTKECQAIQKRSRKTVIGGISITKGTIKANQKKQVTLVVFGANQKELNDNLVFSSPKAETKLFPVNVQLNGLKFSILDSQVGLVHIGKNVSNLNFGNVICWERPMEKVIKLKNKSDKTQKIFCRLYQNFPQGSKRQNQPLQPVKSNYLQDNLFQESLINLNKKVEQKIKLSFKFDTEGKASVNWGFSMQPETENTGFQIVTNEILLPPNSVYPLKVNFTPFRKHPVLSEKEECVLVLYEEEPKSYSNNFIAIKLIANKLLPQVEFECEPFIKSQNPCYTFYKYPKSKRLKRVDQQQIREKNDEVENYDQNIRKEYVRKTINFKNSKEIRREESGKIPFTQTNQVIEATDIKYSNLKSIQDITLLNKNDCDIGLMAIIEGNFVFYPTGQKKQIIQVGAHSQRTFQVKFLGVKQKNEVIWSITKQNYLHGKITLDYKTFYKEEIKKIVPKSEKRNSLASFVDLKKSMVQIEHFHKSRTINKNNINEAVSEMRFLPQFIDLKGILLRPILKLFQSPFKPYTIQKSPQTIDFGIVNVRNKKMEKLLIFNDSKVDGRFKIINKPFQDKLYFGAQTKTRLELENIDKVDDPSVFSFDITQGVVERDSTKFNCIPDSVHFPKKQQKKFNRVFEVRVLFRPKRNYLYKSYYRVKVQFGNTIEFYLKGVGSERDKDFREAL